MFKKLIAIVVLGVVVFWFWSIRPEPSRTLAHLLEGCEHGQCKTTLWGERSSRYRSVLGKLAKEQVSSMDIIGDFPDYLGCAVARSARVIAFEDELRKDGKTIETQTAKQFGPLPTRGSVSVTVDDGSKFITTYTFFCGYRGLVPDRRDSPELLPFGR